jgi:hypothetical protein
MNIQLFNAFKDSINKKLIHFMYIIIISFNTLYRQ